MRVAIALGLLALAPVMGRDSGPSLAVRVPGGWQTWWWRDSAPARWTDPLPALADRVEWRRAAPGLEWGQLSLSGDGEAFRVRVIVARLDPSVLDLRLVRPPDERRSGGRWDIGDAPAGAVFAVNAGQFVDRPWGWIVQDGVEHQRPGSGPLAAAVVLDTSGRMQLVPPDSIDSIRSAARLGFQSYPTVLENDGEIPLPIRRNGLGVDLGHRDARLSLGELRDGRVLIALTRFEGLGGILSNVPVGLTTPEMAAVMGALGARRAVLLDGGVSSQLLIREGTRTHRWPGWRRVPLGLVATPRRRCRGGLRRAAS